jgi:predicted DNA-binding transcriptional regulator AlpA
MGESGDKRAGTRADPATTTPMEELIDEWKLAKMLGVSVSLLAKWRRKGGGPVFIQVATTSVRYAASDVLKWLEEHKLTKKGQPVPKKKWRRIETALERAKKGAPRAGAHEDGGGVGSRA